MFAMQWFDNIKIRNKLVIIFGMLACAILAFAFFAVTQVISIHNNIDELIHSYQARQIHVADATADAYSMHVANFSRGYLLEDESLLHAISELGKNYGKNAELFLENLHAFRTIVLTDPRLTKMEKRQDLIAANDITQSFELYMEIAEKLDAALKSKDKQKMLRVFEEVIPAANILHDQLQNLRDVLFDTTKDKAAATMDITARTVKFLFALTVGFVVLLVFVLVFTVSDINRPIASLEKAVTEIAQGNRACPIRSGRKDELGSLANCIADMVDEISEHTKVTAIMDNLDSMVCVADLNYTLLFVNKRLADAFGLDREKCVGQKCYQATRNKDRPCSFCQMSELLPQKNAFPSKDYEYLWDDGLNAWIGGTDSIIRWVDGSLVFFRSIRDI
jgi:PAS domain S-box-containing protein